MPEEPSATKSGNQSLAPNTVISFVCPSGQKLESCADGFHVLTFIPILRGLLRHVLISTHLYKFTPHLFISLMDICSY